MDAVKLVELVRQIGAHDAHAWTVRPLRRADHGQLAGVLDIAHATGRTGWVVWMDEQQPVLAVVEDRLHWAGMSVLIDKDPFLAVAQAVAALDASRDDGIDSRPH